MNSIQPASNDLSINDKLEEEYKESFISSIKNFNNQLIKEKALKYNFNFIENDKGIYYFKNI